jgi:hypothetical protein
MPAFVKLSAQSGRAWIHVPSATLNRDCDPSCDTRQRDVACPGCCRSVGVVVRRGEPQLIIVDPCSVAISCRGHQQIGTLQGQPEHPAAFRSRQ